MKFKIKYSYEKDRDYGARHIAAAYSRYGLTEYHMTWGNSFKEARYSLVNWLVDFKARRDASMASKLEQKQNPPPPTEFIEI